MKLLYDGISEVIEWKDFNSHILYIENKQFLNEFIRNTMDYLNDGESNYIRIINDKEIEISKSVQLIIDPFSISVNNKDVQKYIEDTIIKEMQLESFMDDLDFSSLKEFITDHIVTLPIDIEVTENYNYKSLLKLFSIDIYDNEGSLLENIETYIKAMSEINLKDLFIFINLKQYLTEEEFNLLVLQMKYEEIPVLFVENMQESTESDLKVTIIDEDLCEI